MDLWIRTQDCENTVKVINGYGLKYNDKKTIIANYQPDFTDNYDGYYEVLGAYKTKERALEVLDEINEIKYYKYMAQLDWNSFVTSVLNPKPIEEQQLLLSMMNTYVMPKE